MRMYKIKQKMTNKTFLEVLFLLLGILVGFIVLVLAQAYLVYTLWNWVIVSLFEVKSITYSLSLGIVLILNLLSSIFSKSKK